MSVPPGLAAALRRPGGPDRPPVINGAYMQADPLVAMAAARGAALSPQPAAKLGDLYRTAAKEDAYNYDGGLIGLLEGANPRVRPAVDLGQFANHPGAQMQQHTAALRGLLAAVLQQRGYRAP